MKRKFLLNLILILALNLLVKPFYIIGVDLEFLQRFTEDYGVYFPLMNLSFILNIFLDIGIINFNTTNIAQNQQLLSKHFAGIITIRIFLSGIYLAILLVAGLVLDYAWNELKLLSLLGFNQILIAFILYFRSNLTGMLRFKADSIISILDRTLLIIFCSCLLWTSIGNITLNINWFVYAQTGAYLVSAITAFLLVVRQAQWQGINWNIPFSLMILKKSWPYALLILLMTIYYRSDGIMIERMLEDGSLQAAKYASGFRFFDALNNIGYLFAGLLLPIFSNLLKENQPLRPLVQLSYKLIFVTSTSAAILAVCYGQEILAWRISSWSPEIIESASISMKLLVCCFVGVSTTYIFGTLLTANGELKILNRLAVGSVLLNIFLNLILIPRYQANGAAAASLITQFLSAIVQIYFVQSKLRIGLPFRFLLQLFSFLALAGIGSYLIISIKFDIWQFEVALVFSVLFLVALITKMLNISEFIGIVRSRTA